MSPLKKLMLAAIGVVVVPLHARGRRRARQAAGLAPPSSRPAFLAGVAADRPVLEIGPFDCPVVRGPHVAYFDVLDTDALRRRAAEVGRSPAAVPSIDYVSPEGDLMVVDRPFAGVVSSHAIEHQPDFVAHLQQIERILVPGGRYHMIVPDRRYSFDHFLSETTRAEIVEAHRVARRVHTRRSILDHRLGTTHNNPLRHWLGSHGRPTHTDEQRATAEREARAADTGEYVDVHAWTFSPESFLTIARELQESGVSNLVPEVVHDTAWGDFEFFAVLRKPG